MASIKTGPDHGQIEEVERLLDATAIQDSTIRAAMVRALARHKTADTLWRWVVVGLLLLAAVALLGVLYLIADGNPATQPELALTAFVGVLGGLLGLLIGAPWRSSAAD
jgi:hypothetical protein